MVAQKEHKACGEVNLNPGSVWRRWVHNYYSRRLLLQLDRAQLKDIGVTREQALEEGGKPFWRK